jgi:hypothetical protein
MKAYLLILTSVFLLAGTFYSPVARADAGDDLTAGQSSDDTEFRNTDDPQETPEDNRVPGEGDTTGADQTVYHCGVNAACN